MQVNLDQSTNEWLEYRRLRIGASDAPIIMGVSPYKTKTQLWREKVYNEQQQDNFAMRRGRELESKALEAYERLTGNKVAPAVFVDDEYEWMMASLDGITLDGKIAVEIKCPGTKDHAIAKEGKVPEKYIPQLQHQYKVANPEVVHYFSFASETDVSLIEVRRDESYIKTLIDEEQRFYDCIRNFEEPVNPREGRHVDLGEVGRQWKEVYRRLKEDEKLEKELRQQLIALAGDESCTDDGIIINKTSRAGSIDYKAIPELKGIDLEQYRKKPSDVWILKLKE